MVTSKAIVRAMLCKCSVLASRKTCRSKPDNLHPKLSRLNFGGTFAGRLLFRDLEALL